MSTAETIIAQTRQWIVDVVIGCNFCPFAGREIKRDTIHYEVEEAAGKKEVLEALAKLFELMKNDPGIETSLLILPKAAASFTVYLQLLDLAEALLEDEGYDGVYQIASFHPAYLFAGAGNDDPANYTNRSPYPMFHLLREARVTKAIESYPNVEDIPQRNIGFATQKGLAQMQQLRQSAINNAVR
ncbi:DUF1415 domain-containing protein [Ferruginibacter sp. HRS2-29]|uniref:DUF1415 domain-containing protein n=1 Tax=Ferruginibacter sp. HRS2-29 TaxID=2487334 RepID=UPI0020CD7E7A|nr:DUF1415 domain-containing protein [Ferruginibacter sp. HRS2-29]MCP9752940.1 DUF1415 domain-containing protein [Ferruginibacter sp. HRS2-29]